MHRIDPARTHGREGVRKNPALPSSIARYIFAANDTPVLCEGILIGRTLPTAGLGLEGQGVVAM